MKSNLRFLGILLTILLTVFLTACSIDEGGGKPTPNSYPSYTLSERLNHHLYPKLFLQIQGYVPDENTLKEAANWDLLVLDAELVANRPEFFESNGEIRKINPYSVIVFYFSAADIIPGNMACINGDFISGLKDEWYMKDIYGTNYHLFWLPDPANKWTDMLNLTTGVNSFMPTYLNEKVVSKNVGDGIFYDWITDNISWLNYRTDNPNGTLDIDNDGVSDSDSKLDSLWVQGTKTMLVNSQNTYTSGTLILGNGGWLFDDRYDNVLNGRMVENFLLGEKQGLSGFGWFEVMRGHYIMHRVSVEPKLSMIMANGDQNDFKFMRFALASTLMFDGYFCYTNNPNSCYGSSWWYDEYSVNINTETAVKSQSYKGYLGYPLSEAYNAENSAEFLKNLLINNDHSAEEKVWRRDFQKGIVLTNPSNSQRTIELNGTFTKIHGIYDPIFNDGQSLSAITMEIKSGVVLLRK